MVKEKALYVGNCAYCDKQLVSNAGGWITSHRKDPATKTNLKFCHDGTENSCFDKFCRFTYELQLNAEMAHVSTLDNNWLNKAPYKEMIENFLKNKKSI